jgi:hypothetical protein
MLSLAHRMSIPLALAALAEVVFLRLLMRTGAFLPRAEHYTGVYQSLMLIGVAAANLASILALAVIAALGVLAWQRGGRARLAALAALAATVTHLWLALVPSSSPVAGVITLALMALTMVGAFLATDLDWRAKAGMAIILAAYLATLYHAIVQPARALGWPLSGGMEAFLAAEVLAVLGVGGVLALVRPPYHRGAAIAGVVVGLLILAARALMPWTMGTATIWTVSFSLFLPAPVYGLVAGLVIYVLVAHIRAAGRLTPLACGLMLIFAGGLKVDHGYFALLALAGFLITVSAAASALSQRPRVWQRHVPPTHAVQGTGVRI